MSCIGGNVPVAAIGGGSCGCADDKKTTVTPITGTAHETPNAEGSCGCENNGCKCGPSCNCSPCTCK